MICSWTPASHQDANITLAAVFGGHFGGQSCSGHNTRLGDENISGLSACLSPVFPQIPAFLPCCSPTSTLAFGPTPKPLALLSFLGQEATLAACLICPGLDLGRRASPGSHFISTLPLQQTLTDTWAATVAVTVSQGKGGAGMRTLEAQASVLVAASGL